MKDHHISPVPKRKRIIRYLLILFVLAFGIYLILDYTGPGKIHLKNDTAFGFKCLRAHDLVVQEFDSSGNLWATRGMIVYKKAKGENEFHRFAHVPTGPSIFWLRNFTIVRRLTIRPECVEVISNNNGDLCALSAGKMWILNHGERNFREVCTLEHYGIGDQGIRNDGLIYSNDSTIFFGEYFQNPDKDKVRILKINNRDQCNAAFTFSPGEIRHIHAIQADPYSDKLWVCTGDDNKESMIGWSDNDFDTIQKIGQGSQLWRVCQLVFTRDMIFWGTDTGDENSAGIYSWDRKTEQLNKYQKVEGAVFFGTRLDKGTIVFSTDREGLGIEKDFKTRLYILSDSARIKCVEGGTWHHKKPGFWFKYAMMRFQRNQGGPALVITCLNMKEFPDSELLIIPEDNLDVD